MPTCASQPKSLTAMLRAAARRGVPLMLYVFSDGSLNADGVVDNSVDGRGKFDWSSDNQQTAASFFLAPRMFIAASANCSTTSA